ncbi:hypothetical protein ACN9SN_005111, partial [Escherichia coli]
EGVDRCIGVICSSVSYELFPNVHEDGGVGYQFLYEGDELKCYKSTIQRGKPPEWWEKQKGSRGIRRGQWYRLVFQFPIREHGLLIESVE